jgi:hypothetical protein
LGSCGDLVDSLGYSTGRPCLIVHRGVDILDPLIHLRDVIGNVIERV